MFKLIKNLCFLGVILIAGIFFWNFFSAIEEDRQERQGRPSGASARQDAQSSTSNARTPPDADLVAFMFRKALRDYMNDPDSYKPTNTRIGNHPKGWAYVHEFRGKNAFGAMIKDCCGLLCSTNSGDYSWTFYDRDQLPDLLKDVTVNGKPIAQPAREGTSTPPAEKPTADTPPSSAKPASAVQPSARPIREIHETTCSACSGRGTIPATVRCSKCGGAGRIYQSGKWQSCPKTITSGTKTCPTCNGTGKTSSL